MALMDLDAPSSLPLNQIDLLGTLGTFTTVTFEALKKLGIAWTDEQRDDYYYFWNVIGWYLGIGDEATWAAAGVAEIKDRSIKDRWPNNVLFPLTADEINSIYHDISKQQQGPSEQGQILAKVLVEELSYPLPGRLRDAPAFLIRYLIGDKKADDLQVDQGGYGDLLIRRSTLLGRVANWSGTSPIVALGVGPLSRMVTRYALRTFLWSARGQNDFFIDPRVAEKWRIQTPPATA